ncbi:hypothetical protein GCM10010503_50100 [Streptomyces lucensis JCM 4490]|uniref:Uncharacterized protein n=1 Tax=Streptomyces lucensis JCM 4490 TaxID=1306176 RepID=A0A918JCD6_9ACTN|nr:hypothetical protein GCM10010503_50100 [Streptomyces lucensis JCM 4490]
MEAEEFAFAEAGAQGEFVQCVQPVGFGRVEELAGFGHCERPEAPGPGVGGGWDRDGGPLRGCLDGGQVGGGRLFGGFGGVVLVLGVLGGRGRLGCRVGKEHQDQDAEGGRGLGMVSTIAQRVVVHESEAGHTVTAELFTDVRRRGPLC